MLHTSHFTPGENPVSLAATFFRRISRLKTNSGPHSETVGTIDPRKVLPRVVELLLIFAVITAFNSHFGQDPCAEGFMHHHNAMTDAEGIGTTLPPITFIDTGEYLSSVTSSGFRTREASMGVLDTVVQAVTNLNKNFTDVLLPWPHCF